MIELYHALISTCSQKVRICLAEKGLDWVDRRINLGKSEHLTPEYLALNPNGVVPTLVHDGRPITESSVICEYLDEVFPEPRLAPTDAYGRALMRAWMRYLEEVPTVAVRVPSFNLAFVQAFKKLSSDEFEERVANRRTLRKQFYKRMGIEGFSQQEFDNSLEQIAKTCERADKALQGGPWLMGSDFSIADIVLFPSIDRMADLGFEHLWTRQCPRVADWHRRMRSRPSVEMAYPAGSRVSETFEIVRPMVA